MQGALNFNTSRAGMPCLSASLAAGMGVTTGPRLVVADTAIAGMTDRQLPLSAIRFGSRGILQTPPPVKTLPLGMGRTAILTASPTDPAAPPAPPANAPPPSGGAGDGPPSGSKLRGKKILLIREEKVRKGGERFQNIFKGHRAEVTLARVNNLSALKELLARRGEEPASYDVIVLMNEVLFQDTPAESLSALGEFLPNAALLVALEPKSSFLSRSEVLEPLVDHLLLGALDHRTLAYTAMVAIDNFERRLHENYMRAFQDLLHKTTDLKAVYHLLLSSLTFVQRIDWASLILFDDPAAPTTTARIKAIVGAKGSDAHNARVADLRAQIGGLYPGAGQNHRTQLEAVARFNLEHGLGDSYDIPILLLRQVVAQRMASVSLVVFDAYFDPPMKLSHKLFDPLPDLVYFLPLISEGTLIGSVMLANPYSGRRANADVLREPHPAMAAALKRGRDLVDAAARRIEILRAAQTQERLQKEIVMREIELQQRTELYAALLRAIRDSSTLAIKPSKALHLIGTGLTARGLQGAPAETSGFNRCLEFLRAGLHPDITLQGTYVLGAKTRAEFSANVASAARLTYTQAREAVERGVDTAYLRDEVSKIKLALFDQTLVVRIEKDERFRIIAYEPGSSEGKEIPETEVSWLREFYNQHLKVDYRTGNEFCLHPLILQTERGLYHVGAVCVDGFFAPDPADQLFPDAAGPDFPKTEALRRLENTCALYVPVLGFALNEIAVEGLAEASRRMAEASATLKAAAEAAQAGLDASRKWRHATGALTAPLDPILTRILSLVRECTQTTEPPLPLDTVLSKARDILNLLTTFKSFFDRIQEIIRVIGSLEISTANRERSLSTFDLNELVQKVMDRYQYLFNTDQVVPQTQLASDLLSIRGISPQIELILAYLLDNARKAVRERSDKNITVSTGRTTDGMVYLRVEDNGSGMSPEIIAAVLGGRPVVIAGRRSTGLEEAFQVAGEHGGRLEIQSTIGVGTTVTMLFPEHLAAG